VSVVSAGVDALYYLYDIETEALTVSVGGFLQGTLLALWIDADSREHPEITRPFDYTFLVLLFLIPYLPYYLWKTRRVAGLLMLAGFVCLFILGIATKVLISYLS
jgi:hypothetical protein